MAKVYTAEDFLAEAHRNLGYPSFDEWGQPIEPQNFGTTGAEAQRLADEANASLTAVQPSTPTPPTPTPLPTPGTIEDLPIDPTIKKEAEIEKTQGKQTAEEQNKMLQDWITKLGGQVDTEKVSRQKQFDELINKQKTTGEQYLGEFKSGRQKRLGDLANLLSQTTERNMAESTPSILEDLSARGLLHSSAVGENLAKRKAQLAAASNEALRAQGLEDLNAEQDISGSNLKNVQDLEKAGMSGNIDLSQWGLEQGTGLGTTGVGNQYDMAKEILKNQMDLRRGGIERNFSIEDLDKELAAARELAGKAAINSRGKNITDLLGQFGGIGLDYWLNK